MPQSPSHVATRGPQSHAESTPSLPLPGTSRPSFPWYDSSLTSAARLSHRTAFRRQPGYSRRRQFSLMHAASRAQFPPIGPPLPRWARKYFPSPPGACLAQMQSPEEAIPPRQPSFPSATHRPRRYSMTAMRQRHSFRAKQLLRRAFLPDLAAVDGTRNNSPPQTPAMAQVISDSELPAAGLSPWSLCPPTPPMLRQPRPSFPPPKAEPHSPALRPAAGDHPNASARSSLHTTPARIAAEDAPPRSCRDS